VEDFSGLYNIRDMVAEDKNFILATSLRGIYYGDSWFSLIPKDTFMDFYKNVIGAMLTKCNVKVACLPDDPSVIIGYSILSSDYQAIVWVYVKQAWRNKGIAKALVPKYPIAVTHLTRLGKTLLPKFEGAIFNPFYSI
jgi:GNAT superfamily N-acetyltransferase